MAPKKTPVKAKAPTSPKVKTTPSKVKGTPSKSKLSSEITATPTKARKATTPTAAPSKVSKVVTPKGTPAKKGTTPKATPAKKGTTPKATPAKNSKTPTKTPKTPTKTPKKVKGKVVKAAQVVDALEAPHEQKSKKDIKVEEDNNKVVIKDTVASKAIEELKKWNERQKEEKGKEGKSQLFDDDEDLNIFLQATGVKFFNKKQSLKPKTIKLPHSPYELGSDFKICLFVKDDQIDELTLSKIEEEEEIKYLRKIVTAQELKGTYKSYESRRKLLSEFDLFLSDDSLITTLPKLLGKIFYSTSKLPIPIRLSSKKDIVSIVTLTNSINKVINSVSYVAPMGVNLTIKLGLLNQDSNNLIENIKSVVESISNSYKIRTFQLKLQESPALPIYVSETLFETEDVLVEAKDSKKAAEEPTLKLSEFEKGLVELALDAEQVESVIGKKVKKVEELKKKRKAAADNDSKKSSKKAKKN